MQRVLPLALLALALLAFSLLVGCSDPPPAEEPAPAPVARRSTGWRETLVTEAGFPVRALAHGRLRGKPSALLAAGEGGALVAWPRDGEWGVESLPAGEGAIHGALVADLDPSVPGDEVFLVGAAGEGGGRAELLTWTKLSGWRATRVGSDAQPLRAALLHEGSLLTAGRALVLHSRREGRWTQVKLAELPSAGRSLVSRGQRVLVGCADGEVVEIALGVDATLVTRDKRVAARNALAVAQGHLVSADSDGTLSLLPKRDGGGLPARLCAQDRVELYRSKRALRGALIGDYAASEGLELLAASEEGELVLLSADAEGRFAPKTLLREVSPLLALHAVGERAVIVGAQGGALTWLERE